MAVKDLLPKEILMRKKHGFGTPIDNWIHNGLKDIIVQKLNDNELIRQYFRKDNINKMTEKFLHDGSSYGTGTVWTVFALGLWFDVCFRK